MIIISSKWNKLFSSWYSWQIADLVLNNNQSLNTKVMSTIPVPGEVYMVLYVKWLFVVSGSSDMFLSRYCLLFTPPIIKDPLTEILLKVGVIKHQ